MSEKFKEQGGVATMDPNPLLRWLTSRLVSGLANPQKLQKKRSHFEQQRKQAGEKHIVEYFHQIDDAYSHLAAQVLTALSQRYDIELVCHLVTGPTGNNSAEPDLLLKLARYDSAIVAADYGLSFPASSNLPSRAAFELASQIFSAQDSESFAQNAESIGNAYWQGDEAKLSELGEQLGRASESATQAKISTGTDRRAELKHYSGAMFYYGQEWYWGVDRLYHLEKRFRSLGIDNNPDQAMLMPRPPIEVGETKDDGSLTLEVYPSLRSPYTAISFDSALQLAKDTGVNLVTRPVLPMVMRGVPATREKGMYIFSDAAREAREADVAYGNFYDPIGEPTRQCYSIYPWACEQGKGNELISSFLSSVFAQGINTNNHKGLQKVVEKAGLDWRQAKQIVGQSGWEEGLESNRLAMYDAGLWGVPSFRLLDQNDQPLLELWGQDRLWLIARKIKQHLSQ